MAMRSLARVPDWFDEDWAVVVENARVHAWVCREAGLVGIMNDVEEAGILDYSPARRKRHSFETYARRVRACAREWMEALVTEYPDIIVMTTHGYTEPARQMELSGLQLEHVQYALLPAFLDGLLDGAGETATVIDGCELTYPLMCYQTFRNFHRFADLAAEELSALPASTRTRLQKAIALWPSFPADYGHRSLAEADGQTGTYNFNADRLQHALYNALHATDRYVWLWNGANCWWEPSLGDFREKARDGRIHRVPPSFVQAVASARSGEGDLDWTPLRPVPGEDPPEPATPPEVGEPYEVLRDLADDWWFITSPDNCEPQNRDQLAGWAGLTAPRYAEGKSGWHPIRIGAPWQHQGRDYNGVAYYRQRFTVPDKHAGRSLKLLLHGVQGSARVFASTPGFGRPRRVGGSGGGKPAILDIKGAVVPGRASVLTIEITQWAGPGGLLGPVRIVAPREEAVPAAPPPRSILLDLGFEEVRDGHTPDASHFAHRVEVNGATTVDGVEGKALRFDGEDDHVLVPDSPVFDLPGGALSWELWFNQEEPVTDDIIFHTLITKTWDYTNGLLLNYQDRSNPVTFIQNDPNRRLAVPAGARGRWHHVVGTCEGTEQRLYLDGRLVGSQVMPLPPPLSSQPIRIGGGGADTWRGSRVSIDNVRLYNYALSGEEIGRRYRAHHRDP